MSPVPVDPFPNFVPGALADADAVDARFKKLYDTLDPAIVGIDSSNVKDGGIVTADLADLAVTTGKLAANAVTAAKIEAQQAWQTGAFAGALSGTCKYFKDSLGMVHVQSLSTLLLVSSGSGTAFTFPAGYRPIDTISLVAKRGNSTTDELVFALTTAGVLSATNGATAGQAVLAGWSWRAEA